jgi:hypothetical protein
MDFVVMDPGLQPAFEVEVSVAWVLDGAFVGGLALVAVAAGVLLVGRRWVRS